MIASVVSSFGLPFQALWTENKYHIGVLTVQGIYVLYQIFSRRNGFVEDILDIKPLPLYFCAILCSIVIGNIALSLLLARLSRTLLKKQSRTTQ